MKSLRVLETSPEKSQCVPIWISYNDKEEEMSLFDPTGIIDGVVKAIDVLGARQAEAIIEGFERAAKILADRLEEIEKENIK